MNKFAAVTTFNFKKQPYGLDLIESFYKFWPDDCMLYVFLENGMDKIEHQRIENRVKFYDYQESIPNYYKFC